MILVSQLVSQRGRSPFLAGGSGSGNAPGVVWEMGSGAGLSPIEAAVLVDDLADAGSPFLIFSAGGPDLRDDLPALVRRARRQNLSAVLALCGPPRTKGLGYVLASAGLSLLLDLSPSPETPGLLAEFRAAGVPVGLRQNLTDHRSIGATLSLAEQTGCTVCVFRHSAEAGGRQTRGVMDQLYRAAVASPVQIATEGNRADAVYLYLRLLQDRPDQAGELRSALFAAGERSLFVDVAHVSADGDVSPEENWSWGTVGNVRQRRFSQIWNDPQHPLLRGLRSSRLLVQGRCRICGYLEACDGNHRARATALGDLWAEDPGCYLTDEEIRGKPR